MTYREETYSDGSPRSINIIHTDKPKAKATSDKPKVKSGTYRHNGRPYTDTERLESLRRECAGYEKHPEWYQNRDGSWTMNVQKSFDALAALEAELAD